MAGCVLRVSGENFDVDAFLNGTNLKPYQVYRAGDEVTPGSKTLGRFDDNGFKVDVSDADDLPAQIEDALAFLRAHQSDLRKLAEYNADAQLDFGISRKNPEEFPAQYDSLPVELLRLSGNSEISICLSHYFF